MCHGGIRVMRMRIHDHRMVRVFGMRMGWTGVWSAGEQCTGSLGGCKSKF